MATLRVLRLNSNIPMQQPGAGIEDIKGPTTGNCDTPGFTDGPIAYTFTGRCLQKNAATS